MVRPTRFEGPDMTVPAGRVGLTQRLAEKAEARQRVFLPVYRPAWVKDVKR